MGNDVKHFAINADDVSRARRFYEKVFGWKIEPWGPPKFFLITTSAAPDAVRGALQGRRELLPGQRMVGYECTIGVDDVDKVAEAVRANGGRMVMEKTPCPAWAISSSSRTPKATSPAPCATTRARNERGRGHEATAVGRLAGLAALVAGLVILQVPSSRGYGRRVLVCAALGLLVTLDVDASYWNWYGFPTRYFLAQLVDHTVGWLVAGLVLARVCRPELIP
jgi:predicted enzyme related to lactoylglutathione lyase